MRKTKCFRITKSGTKLDIYFIFAKDYIKFMIQKPQILIGAASSGSGKTTFTLGLLRALKNRGLKAQPFKCGPDYIDTKYHTLAAGEESVNLDSYFSSEAHLHYLYATYGAEADACVAEGVMGLFDGYEGMQGSSAEIARLLHIPVVLVVNARSMAYSVAPLIYGFKNFCKDIRIAGIVFNMVGSSGHYEYLKEACRDAGVECFGYLPKQKEIEIPSRHLGLTLDEKFAFDAFADKVAALIEEYVDIERILKCTVKEFPADNIVRPVSGQPAVSSGMRIAVARDEAFNFIYRENIAQLQRLGQVEFFSPMKDAVLPPADLVYLPGGYPEFYLSSLSDNHSMLQSVRDYAEKGGKLLAECGGMMYLCRSITGMDGRSYPMAGVLPQEATMEQMKLKLGYRNFVYNGVPVKGHEFHYSRIVPAEKPLPSVAELYTARGMKIDTPLYRVKNVIAGYTHLYWGEMDLSELWDLTPLSAPVGKGRQDTLICIDSQALQTPPPYGGRGVRLYTKGGDKGKTGIHGGQRVDKDDIRIEANGTIDELNSVIGIVRSMLPQGHEWQEMLREIQMELMVVMSHVATPSAIREKNPNRLREDLDVFCEQHIDRITACLEDNGYFILPGGTQVSAQCQFARTVARRAERRLWTLNRKDEVPAVILRFINRLSDLFFVMAKLDMQQQGTLEERWQSFLYKRKK